MTDSQRITLMADWWPAACRVQGWKTSDRALRLRVLSIAVSLGKAHFHAGTNQAQLLDLIKSNEEPPILVRTANDLDTQGDVDAVKACLLFLADNLDGAGEIGHPERGERRRLLHEVNKFPLGLTHKILHDRFTWAFWLRLNHSDRAGTKKKDAPEYIVLEYTAAAPSAPPLGDLNVPELKQLRSTLVAITRRPTTRQAQPEDDNVPF